MLIKDKNESCNHPIVFTIKLVFSSKLQYNFNQFTAVHGRNLTFRIGIIVPVSGRLLSLSYWQQNSSMVIGYTVATMYR